VGINGCRLQLLVPKQDLDHADVDLLIQQVRGEGVALNLALGMAHAPPDAPLIIDDTFDR